MTRNPIARFRVQAVLKLRPRLNLAAVAQTSQPQTSSSSNVLEQPIPAEAATTAIASDSLLFSPNSRSGNDPDPVTAPPHPSTSATSSVEPAQYSQLELHLSPEVNPPASPEKLTVQVKRGLHFLGMPLVWLIVLAFCTGTGVSAFLWLTTLPPLPNCDRLQPLLASESDRLYCAEQSAKSGKAEALLAGLQLVKNWSAQHPLYHRANRLVQDWSKALLAIARTKAAQDDLTSAIALAKEIPATSTSSKAAQGAIVTWKNLQQQSQVMEAAIQPALKAQNWKQADVQLQALAKREGEYWKRQLSRLRQQTIQEQLARRELQRVQSSIATASNNPELLGQLITAMDQIDPNSYARPEANTLIQQLNQLLLALINTRLAQEDIPGAIALTQWVPRNIALSQPTKELIWLSQAQSLAASQAPDDPIPEQLLKLQIARAQMQQIDAGGQLYATAQALLPKLDVQIQDLTYLQLVMSVASLAHIPALQFAIHLAQALPPDRPQDLYRQTLIAQWKQDLELIADRPYMQAARQLAAKQGIPNWQAAIAIAKKIAPGRPLRSVAQAAIFDWTQNIQIVEDRPIWQKAQALANQKKLPDAIQMAGTIRPNRALYADAQAAVQTWTNQLQIAEDRPMLSEANALADQGQLSAAIDLASGIAPGRALYGEAKSAIALWDAQRSIIRKQRSNSPSPSKTQEPTPKESSKSETRLR